MKKKKTNFVKDNQIDWTTNVNCSRTNTKDVIDFEAILSINKTGWESGRKCRWYSDSNYTSDNFHQIKHRFTPNDLHVHQKRSRLLSYDLTKAFVVFRIESDQCRYSIQKHSFLSERIQNFPPKFEAFDKLTQKSRRKIWIFKDGSNKNEDKTFYLWK